MPAFRGAKITIAWNGNRTLRYKDGRTVTFTSDLGIYEAGVAIGVADANGNGLTMTRPSDQAFNITTITDANGRGVTFTRDTAVTPSRRTASAGTLPAACPRSG